MLFCFYISTAQQIDSSSTPKWIWWGYNNSKMPSAVVTDVSLDSKNKIWLSFCDSQHGGIANFTKTDMSDFYHFNRYTKPGLFGTYNCVLSLPRVRMIQHTLQRLGLAALVFIQLMTQIVNNYGCIITGDSENPFYQWANSCFRCSSLLRVGDTIWKCFALLA